MNQKALRTLEYHKIIEQLTEAAGSTLGKEVCRNLVPSVNLSEIQTWQRETSDALSRIYQKGSLSFSGVYDVRGSLKRLEIGSILGIDELLRLCKLLETCARVKAFSRRETDEEGRDTLDDMFEALMPLTPLSAEIRRCIVSEDEISDDASPKLRQIRRSMKQTNDKIHSQLASMVNGSARTYLQDAVVTMRQRTLLYSREGRTPQPGARHDSRPVLHRFYLVCRTHGSGKAEQ